MRNGLIISAILHLGMIVLAVFGLPVLFQPDEPETQPLLVELVTVAEVTTSQAPPEPEPEPEPEPVKKVEVEKKPPPKPPEPVAAPAPPRPAPPEVKPAPPAPKPEPKPKELAELPKPAPKPAPRPKPKPEPQAKPVDLSKAPKPRTKPVRPEKRFSADRIAALLDKRQKDKPPPVARAAETAAKAAAPAEPQPAPRLALSTDQPLTMNEIDAIRFQIQQCWSVPAGARDAENLVVRIRIFLKPDGSLARPPEIIDGARMNLPGENFFRVAAESARRAVQKCSPLKNLPVTKYERWREITLTFNPKEMLQG